MELLEKKIALMSPLSPGAMAAFKAAWQVWQVPAHHFLLREKSVSDYLYFIEEGVARIFYHKHDKQITEWIALDGNFFLSITSYFERTPSKLNIQTLEPSLVYGIHNHDFMRMAAENHEVETLLRRMVTRSLIMSQERMDSIQFESAQQRYEKLLENSPGILQRVPLTYIASFLGVTLETLSRIRSGK